MAAQIDFQHPKTLQNFSFLIVSNLVNFIFQTLQCIDFKNEEYSEKVKSAIRLIIIFKACKVLIHFENI